MQGISIRPDHLAGASNGFEVDSSYTNHETYLISSAPALIEDKFSIRQIILENALLNISAYGLLLEALISANLDSTNVPNPTAELCGEMASLVWQTAPNYVKGNQHIFPFKGAKRQAQDGVTVTSCGSHFLFPFSLCPIDSSRGHDTFPQTMQHATQTAAMGQYPWETNTFIQDGEDHCNIYTYSNPGTNDATIKDEAESSMPAQGRTTELDWPDQLRYVGNPLLQHSPPEAAGGQDASNSTTSRNATGREILICDRAECFGKRFARYSELQRHKDRHDRPFMCNVAACNKKDFADRGSLQRHNREVHKNAKYFCPVTQCERHKRGFGRKYNLLGHERRVHRGALSSTVSPTYEGSSEKSFLPGDDRQHHSGSEGGEGFVDEDEEIESPQDMMSQLSQSERLKRKLRKLRAKKADHESAGKELARDIAEVERLLLDAICEET